MDLEETNKLLDEPLEDEVGFTAYADMREHSEDSELMDSDGRPKRSIFSILISIAFIISALMIVGSIVSFLAIMEGCVPLPGRGPSYTVEGSEEPLPETEDLVATHIPYFNNTRSSSEKYSWNDAYSADKVIDFDSSTAWEEGVEGMGMGEWVEIRAQERQVVRGVRILGGIPESEWRYKANCRPCDVLISLSDGTEIYTRLADSYNEYQLIMFDEPHETSFIRVTIETVYEGTGYYDTCIAEIQAF